MRIVITKGVGAGRTALSAFDAALYAAGIANYNLLQLSSIVPPGSVITAGRTDRNEAESGHKLYVVLSRKDQLIAGGTACAGLGWFQSPDGSGAFAEYSGESEDDVRWLIRYTLEDMARYRHGCTGGLFMEVEAARCTGQPVSVVVAAVFASEGWEPTPQV